MKIKNEIKGLIYTAGYTLSDVAEKMGHSSVQNLSQKISRGTLKYSELKLILDVIGYKVEFKKADES
ncbi:LLM class flavin-dependent oxidoreductase [bacterium]|jgi:hypothetical protein|nr:LLM class flavin-dependent oxidoreductase [bacterium]